MTPEEPGNPALIVIDVQKGIDEATHWGGNRNNPEAEGKIRLLMEQWESKGFPVFVIQHLSRDESSPFFPGKSGQELKDFIRDFRSTERIQKSAANAFINTHLEQKLRDKNVSRVFIAGFVTNNSVEATARMTGDLGFITTVIHDACAAFNKVGVDGNVYSSELIHQISLANLSGEYASIKSTQQVLAEIVQ
jgi:nicotinamidase-related amidase